MAACGHRDAICVLINTQSVCALCSMLIVACVAVYNIAPTARLMLFKCITFCERPLPATSMMH